MRQAPPYHRRIDAGILAGMIVPPPALELDAADADEPIARERRSAASRLGRDEPDEQRDEQQSRELERMLRDDHR